MAYADFVTAMMALFIVLWLLNTKEEVQQMRTEYDPIEQVRKRMLDNKLANEDELKQIDKDVRAIVNEAAEFAQNTPEPDESELYTDIVKE